MGPLENDGQSNGGSNSISTRNELLSAPVEYTAKLAKGSTKLRIRISSTIILNAMKTVGDPTIAETTTIINTSTTKNTEEQIPQRADLFTATGEGEQLSI